ncbi:hypothetical protein G3N95_01880 [Paraburkholderia sp. Tr-20389]|uniref:hypothetical protein n=1 Tax=Paraburkholderia sp. Tr-20389 TaxID=2703903 RepID=UPI00197ED35A|nr:hypothetical protein [Paraburkholderia sp. Tr-20389]MBN3751671.1 hypothetical protein [Paraburkholderia sp. Tr-20389]
MANGRSSYGVFSIVFVTALVLAWGSSFNGPAFRIRHEYWSRIVPLAIPVAIFIAWRLQKMLVGSWYTPRYASQERQMGIGESWATAVLAAVILVGFGTEAAANVMNQVVGVSYVATYEVASKFVERGKHTCYGLTLIKVDDPTDQFQICVSNPEQEGTATGERWRVNGRRSRYVNQMLGYTRYP